MSSKSSKKTTVTTSSSQSTTTATSTPSTQSGKQSASSGSASSPLSPTRLSRLQEKAELQNLNDRLAAYIDRVRHLETENNRLTREVNTSQETVTREVTNIKTIFEQEINDARKLLDETAKEKAKVQIAYNKSKAEIDELKPKLDKKTKDLQAAEKSLTILESQVVDLGAKYNQTQAEKKKLHEENKEFRIEIERLRKQLEECRKQLEMETLNRVDLENKNQSIREDLAFKEQLHQQQITETRNRKQVEITEIDGQLQEKYEAKLQESLQELREEYEDQLAASRGDIEEIYDSKINDLKTQVSRYSGVAASTADELRQTRTRMDTLTMRLTEMETSEGRLNARIRDLERQLDNDRARFTDELAGKENDLHNLRNQMSSQLGEYQQLMDIKIALDLEIATYRKLLESEEGRLNITPGRLVERVSQQGKGGTPVRRTPLRGQKRKRTILEEKSESRHADFISSSTVKGVVEVAEVCPDGKFVRLHNKGNKEVSLSGWQIIRKAGGNQTTHKFHRTVKLDGGASVRVWSSDTNQTSEPPEHLVMKGQKWFVADSMTTTLINNSGEEEAVHESRREQLSQSHLHQRESGSLAYQPGEVGGLEDIYHHKGDPRAERCSVM